jgi:hypothetical protein
LDSQGFSLELDENKLSGNSPEWAKTDKWFLGLTYW